MPRAFSDTEKTQLRAALLEHGRQLLATYGMRKTNVEDLTNAVGISKGAFYLFFDSKEELFFTLFEQFEADYQTELLQIAAQPAATARAQIANFLDRAFALWRSNPLFRHFGRDEYEALVRRLPPERIAAALHSDERFVASLLEQWRDQGLLMTIEPAVFTGLMRALFFVSLHADEIGPAYQATIATLSTALAAHCTEATHA